MITSAGNYSATEYCPGFDKPIFICTAVVCFQESFQFMNGDCTCCSFVAFLPILALSANLATYLSKMQLWVFSNIITL